MALTTKTAVDRLPQHILSQVVTHAIQDSQPDEALRLRLVNKRFNHEVLHVVFEKASVTFQSSASPNEVTVFRYFRGFLLRRECEERLRPLRQRLFEAAVLLTDLAKTLSPSDQLSGDFFGLYESEPEQRPSEEAIAALATAAMRYVGGPTSVCQLWASARRRESGESVDSEIDIEVVSHHTAESDVISDLSSIPEPDIDDIGQDDAEDDNETPELAVERGPWTVFEAKNVNFWVLLTVSFFGKPDLVQQSLISLREGVGPEHSLTHDLQSVFHLPVEQGHQPVVRFLLEQPELAPMYLPQSFILNGQNPMEAAIKAEQVSIVKSLLAHGWDIANFAVDYTSALMVSIRHTKDATIREELVRLLLGLTQEWRSGSMVAGIFREVCAKGDAKLAEIVLQMVKNSTIDAAQFTWTWTLPDRNEDWAYDERSALLSACTNNNTELVKFLFENQQHLPRSMSESFRKANMRTCIELAIGENSREMLAELIKHKKTISMTKLMAYATIKGDIDTLKMIAKDIDLDQKTKRHGYFQSYDSGSCLYMELNNLDLENTPFVHEKGLLTDGGFCLILAIKALKVENAKYFIDRGVRIGTHLTFLCRNFFSTKASLIADDYSPLGSRAFVLTYKQIYLTDCKNMLGRGAMCFNNALVVTKKSKGWWRWKVQTSKVLKDCDARALSCIEIPQDSFEEDEYDKMWLLLKKHHLPLPYVD